MLSVDGLAKRFGESWALRGASFSVRAGEVLGLVGPNGSGKTTLLECIAGLLPSDGGAVLAGARALGARERRDALFYMPDAILPWPEQTVGWATRFTAAVHGKRGNDVMAVEGALGLDGLREQHVGTLSKGQRKRALLAIGLLTPQPFLLVDEPFDGLDLKQSREVAATLRAHAARGRTLFLSIHQIVEAARLCDRFVLLSEGTVRGEGTLAELEAMAAARGEMARDLEGVFLALT